MSHSGIIQKGAVAVITGAASGIGLAAAQIFAKEGLSLFLVDVSDGLDAAVDQVRQVEGVGQVESMRVDVSKVDEVVKMRERVFEDFGEVHILMNNAGVGRPTPAFSLDTSLEDLQNNWNTVLGTNLFGVLNVAQAFAPHMVRQENASVIINTGSKQGITCPPGNAGYNVSKAAVKTYTEQLAHELRNAPYSTCSAHLFVPGWTHTGMTGGGKGSSKPHGAWTAEQTVEYMIDKVFDQGDFYVICPDNETSSALDKARMLWSLGDVVENRPALSRWHPAYKARFEDFIAQKQGLSARSRSRGRPMERSESGMALNSPKVVAGPTIIE